jgi:hypothetical protein
MDDVVIPVENNQDDVFIPVEEAAALLKMTPRNVNRYGHEGKIATKKVGKRVLYSRVDVELLAEELNVELRAELPVTSKAELMPVGEMLQYVRERDQQLKELQAQLVAAAAEIGRLQERVAQHQCLLEMQQVSWWERLFGNTRNAKNSRTDDQDN